MEFFEYIKNIFTKQVEMTTEDSHQDVWGANRFLSGSPISFGASAELNLYLSRIPKWASGMFLYCVIPQLSRAPWLARDKKEVSPYPLELIAKIAESFCCSSSTAIQYIILLEKQNVDPYKLYGLKRKANGQKNSQKKKRKGATSSNRSAKKDERFSKHKKSRRKLGQ